MAHTGCILHNQAKVEEYKAGHSLEVPLMKGDNLGGCNHYLHWSVCRSLTRSEADSRGCEDCIIGGNEHFALQTLLTCYTTVQQRSSEWYQIIASRIWQDVGNQTKENVPARIEVDEDYGQWCDPRFLCKQICQCLRGKLCANHAWCSWWCHMCGGVQ